MPSSTTSPLTGVHGVDVSPVVWLHNVNHDLRLVVIRRHNTHEGAEARLIRKVFGGGRVSDLRDREELQEILHLQSDGAGSRPSNANQRRVLMRVVGQWSVRAQLELLLVRWFLSRVRGYRLADELDRLLQRDRRVPAWIADFHAERDVFEQVLVLINFIDRLENDLAPLNAVVLANLSRKRESRKGKVSLNRSLPITNGGTGGAIACPRIIAAMQIKVVRWPAKTKWWRHAQFIKPSRVSRKMKLEKWII